jgi:hypothetical protein
MYSSIPKERGENTQNVNSKHSDQYITYFSFIFIGIFYFLVVGAFELKSLVLA